MLITIIMSILTVIILIASFVARKAGEKKISTQILLALLIPAIFLGIRCIAIIPANTVGIVWSPVSGTSENTLSEGMQLKTPFDQIYKISTEVQTATLVDITGQTKDSQYITLSNVSENFVTPTVQRSVEAVTTKYNVIDILGERRNDVYYEIEKELEERFAQVGITFIGINFNDTDADAQIEAAITAEAVATKEVATAEQRKLKAQIDAETKIIEAQGEADANAVKEASITANLLKMQWIERWNGELPVVAGESGGMIYDLSNLAE